MENRPNRKRPRGPAVDLENPDEPMMEPVPETKPKAEVKKEELREIISTATGEKDTKPAIQASAMLDTMHDPRLAHAQRKRKPGLVLLSSGPATVKKEEDEKKEQQAKPTLVDEVKDVGPIVLVPSTDGWCDPSHFTAAPDVEWWDKDIMKMPSYRMIKIKDDAVTDLIHHPANTAGHCHCPQVEMKTIVLTPAELRRKRHNERLERRKEEEEKIRLGEKEKPVDRITKHSLMTVHKDKISLTPTEAQQLLREQKEERMRNHAMMNWERHLDAQPHQYEKKIADIKKRSTDRPVVGVYLIRGIKDRHPLGTVQLEGKERHLKGKLLWIGREHCVILLWGGQQPMREMDRLIMHRIDWSGKYEGAHATQCFIAHSEPNAVPGVFLVDPAAQGGKAAHPTPVVAAVETETRDPSKCVDVVEFGDVVSAMDYCREHHCLYLWDVAVRE